MEFWTPVVAVALALGVWLCGGAWIAEASPPRWRRTLEAAWALVFVAAAAAVLLPNIVRAW